MLEVGKYCTSVLLFYSRTVASIFSPLHHLPACLPANWENSPGCKISGSLYQWEWGTRARRYSGSVLVSAGPVLGEATKATICTSGVRQQGSPKAPTITQFSAQEIPRRRRITRRQGSRRKPTGAGQLSFAACAVGLKVVLSPSAQLPCRPRFGEMLNADSDLMITEESQLPC